MPLSTQKRIFRRAGCGGKCAYNRAKYRLPRRKFKHRDAQHTKSVNLADDSKRAAVAAAALGRKANLLQTIPSAV